MLELERVFERIDDYREEIIELQTELTSRVALGADNVLSAINEICTQIGAELGLQIKAETAYRKDAVDPTPSDAPVVKALAAGIKKVTGREAKPMGIGGGTVAAFFREVGLPVAVWSTVSNTAHQPNEYCHISNIITDAKIFACLYMDG